MSHNTKGLTLAQALRLKSGAVVAFTGGGGKSTAMFRLAAELAPTMRVLTTTSTRIFAAQIQQSPAHITFDSSTQNLTDILPQLRQAIAQHGQVLLIGKTEPESGKAFGISPQIIDELAGTGYVDIILNEADGSRMRPFKAPATHEPVIPKSTTLVVPVVGLDIVGQPLNDNTAHRSALVSKLSNSPQNNPVTVDTVARVIAHPQGGLKGVPEQARVVPLLNKAEDTLKKNAAQKIAARLLISEKIDSVVIGSVRSAHLPVAEVWGQIAAIVLAAGGSTRFGSPKQVAQWKGITFIEHVVDAALASRVQNVVVVLGAETRQSMAVLRHHPVKITVNSKWAAGQSSSMKQGLAALPSNVSGAIFLLVDQPAVTPNIINALIDRHRQTLAPVVWPEFKGQRGNPVLFDQALFPELAQVSGDTGGRPVLLAHKNQAERITVTNKGVLLDIDRPKDLEEKI